MADSTVIPAKVLFVDDDVSFLQMMRDVFGDASGGKWDIQTAGSAADALRMLRSHKVNLAVIDVFMPGMDGLQLQRLLNEEFPSLPKVLLTGMPDGNTRAAALEGGAALFLEKPASAAGYDSVFATLNELLHWHGRYSSRGNLRQLGLLDLVKLECKSGNSRVFEVFAGEMRGEIFIKAGVIIHALMPDRRGQSAFTYLTTTPGAVFYLRQYVEPIERSIDRQWEFMVMEAAQILEQIAQLPPEPEEEEAAPAAVVPSPPPAVPVSTPKQVAPAVPPKLPPPSPPVSAPAPVVAAPEPEGPPEQVSAPRTPRVGAPEPTPMEMHAAPEWKIAEAPDACPLAVVVNPAGFKVEEMLLCAEFSEVQYESHCVDTNKRMRLAEAVEGRARYFAMQLPLGELDRAELHTAYNRVVLRYEAKRCLLVRTNTKRVQPTGDEQATEAPETWLAGQPVMRGLLAAAIQTADGRMFHRSFTPDFAADVTQLMAREAMRLPELATKHFFPAWSAGLIFTRCQLQVIRRLDGAVFCAFLLRSGQDLPAVSQFFNGFAQVRPV